MSDARRLPARRSKIDAGLPTVRSFCHSHGRPILDGREAGRTADFGKLLSEFVTARGQKWDTRTIAFPAISCGAYGYPIREAARIAVETTREFLATDAEIDKVIFVVASDEILGAYQHLSPLTPKAFGAAAIRE